MSACDIASPLRHSQACRQGLSRRCRQDWCQCACHSALHRGAAAKAGRAPSAASDRAAEEVDRLIRGLASTGQLFSADTIRPLLPPDLSANQIGAAFLAASKAGLIERTGDWQRAGHEAAHGRLVPTWRGTTAARATRKENR